MNHSLAAQTAPRTQRERLTRLLDVRTVAIYPPFGPEPHRFGEITLVVRDCPRAGVDFGLKDCK